MQKTLLKIITLFLNLCINILYTVATYHIHWLYYICEFDCITDIFNYYYFSFILINLIPGLLAWTNNFYRLIYQVTESFFYFKDLLRFLDVERLIFWETFSIFFSQYYTRSKNLELHFLNYFFAERRLTKIFEFSKKLLINLLIIMFSNSFNLYL